MKDQTIYQAIFNSSSEAVFSYDTEGKVTSWNKASALLYGFEEADALGISVIDLITSKEHANEQTVFSNALHGREVRNRGSVHQARSGKKLLVTLTLNQLKNEDGEVYGIAAFSHISMEGSGARPHDLLESAPDAMVVVDRHGIIQLINSQTEKLFGFHRSELIGEPVEILIPNEYRKSHPTMREGFSHDPKFRAMGVGLELFGKKKNGEKFPVEISLGPIETRDGLLIASAIRDITEQKKAAQELKNYASQLEASNKELESFTYIASHDLKEPLRKVNTFATLLLQSEITSLSDEGKFSLKRIVNSINHMQNLIDDLLAFSKIKNTTEEFYDLDLNEVIGNVRSRIHELLHEKNAKVHADVLPEVYGIRFQLEQLFENIIQNSLKYSKPGIPPVIQISVEHTTINQVVFVRLNIQDNGIGFEQAYGEQIFELFKRLHNRNEYPGSGIGLAICKRIVQNHKGMIEAMGIPGEGATISIYLPAKT